MKITDFPIDEPFTLKKLGTWPAASHFCKREHFAAVVAAWHANRPLLVRGEPGIGKSQLANAVAQVLGWQFISIGIQPQMSYQDLLWEFDAVSRLADAQVLPLLASSDKTVDTKQALDKRNYIIPGPLWWAYRPDSIKELADDNSQIQSPHLVAHPDKNELVLLIDEIDKADASLPNGLLEVFGNGDITLPSRVAKGEALPNKPLVIITSNDERQLPPAFLRRCLVLDLKLPSGEALLDHLLCIADAHADNQDSSLGKVPLEVRTLVARRVMEQRSNCPEQENPPGLAEFLDLLRVLAGIGGGPDEMKSNLDNYQHLILTKKSKREGSGASY